ncbi:hypothetical protein [Metakosakonia massiliensis]|uniref:Uncharacterized protein n=1 Tax=Phytobacter massiliensis TaxID=1485952 RepID=A0A6N3HKH9_9ENTR|nr:hypothetical protein [Phytobacter massiliensis]
MSKDVVVILPGGKVDHVSVDDGSVKLSYKNDQRSFPDLPIEAWTLDGKEVLIARFSDLVTARETEAAIRQFY